MELFTSLLLLAALLALYFLPAIVAAERGHRNANAIFVLNLFLGWTLLGWIIALVWSLTYQERDNVTRDDDGENVVRRPGHKPMTIHAANAPQRLRLGDI